ncbi:MAG: helix-turn-helix transcriptional regulator [Lawsonibacter sp.]|nr:helix-turn-helix transcriptional regulator [Lawsonibacter sp.]
MEKPEFGMRVAELRMSQKEKISARDMSLSIGLSEGYINNIENGNNYPSMEAFFYICEYLGVTPIEFFDRDRKDPRRMNRLLEAARGLDSEQLDHLIALAKDLRRK